MTTNGSGWRDVIDVVRTLVIVLSVCVRRFVCEWEDCEQRSFDEGIDRGGASSRALRWFADLARGRTTRAVARDLGVPEHYLRLAVGQRRADANARARRRLGAHLAIDECSVRKNFIYATVFSDPDRGVVLDMAPGRDASAVLFFASLYSHVERAAVRVVTIDRHAPYRMAVRVLFPNAVIVADAFHIHRRVLAALTQVRRDAWNRWRHRSRRLGKVFKERPLRPGPGPRRPRGGHPPGRRAPAHGRLRRHQPRRRSGRGLRAQGGVPGGHDHRALRRRRDLRRLPRPLRRPVPVLRD